MTKLNFLNKLNFIKQKNLILPAAIVIAAIVIGGVIYFNNSQKKPSGFLSAQEASQKAIDFINQNILQEQNLTASLVNIAESNGLYKMKLKIGEEEIETYLSLDGQLLFPQVVTLAKAEETTQGNQTGEVPKTNAPIVRLFVMSHCPYGLQAQKALLPVYELLKDKADIGVYFVNYIMHGKEEIDDNLRQFCIQKEQLDKYGAYLSCFVKDGNFSGCLSEAKIDMNALDSCIAQTDQQFNISVGYNDKSTWINGQYPKFDVNASLNTQLGVTGSPTFFINEKLVEINRSPEELKKAICNAFTTPPEECSQTLSTEIPSAGFGSGTGSSGSGSCE